jgi:hypothetical protein
MGIKPVLDEYYFFTKSKVKVKLKFSLELFKTYIILPFFYISTTYCIRICIFINSLHSINQRLNFDQLHINV